MTTKLNRFFALTAIVSLTGIGTQALADSQNSGNTVYISENSTNVGQTVNLVLPVQPSVENNYFSGSLNITTGASLKQDGSIANGASFLAYCIDPLQYTSSSPVAYSNALLSSLGSTRETEISNLYSQSYASTAGNSLKSSAFQLALWELAKDDGVLTTGGVHITNSTDASVVTEANSMISSATHGTVGANHYSFNLYTSGTNQDFLVATLSSVTPVPEPESYAMLLAGLGLIGFTARRRQTSR